MGDLEKMLPLFWNTLARHMLPCRLIKQSHEHGKYRACNTLTYERMHVNIRSWASSTKSLLVSIRENYSRHCQAQLQQFKKPTNWVIQGKAASLFNKFRDWKDHSSEGAVPDIGKKNYRPLMVVLPRPIFSQLQVKLTHRFCLPIVDYILQNVSKTHETYNIITGPLGY